ncbi:MAG: UbiA family prenyltransferase [Planctomycetota bacterium]
MPRPPRTIIGRTLERAGNLALVAGCYQAGLVIIVARLVGVPVRFEAAAGAFLLTVGVYLLDRVKPIDAWIDEADRMAHPRRAAFLLKRTRMLRGVIVVVSIGAAVLLAQLHIALPLLVIAAHAGVLLYGSLPHRPRVKDRFVLKNLAVAIAMTALAFLLVTIETWRTLEIVPVMVVATFMLLHVMSDAMLCDLDDREADAAHGTATVPVRCGSTFTWGLVALLQTIAMTVLICAGLVEIVPIPAATMFGVGLLIGTIALKLWSPMRVRDLVDLKLPLVVLISVLAVR